VSVLYADTSALVRAYFADEPDHDELRTRLLEGEEPVVSSELTRVEFASAVSVAARAERLQEPGLFLDRFDADCGDDGPIALLRLDSGSALPLAYRLVVEHDLRTVDAVHLAVAATSARELAAGEPVILVTRDDRQAAAAAIMGLEIA
jgi:predicted nucleic acid-binding protein